MPKSLEELQASKAGSTAESNGFGASERPQRPAGLYRNKETGEEIITKFHPIFASTQADAVVRLGFEYVRPATSEELSEKVQYTVPGAAQTGGGNSEELKGIYARLNAIEEEKAALAAENEALKAAQAPADEEAEEEKSDEAEAEAEDQSKKTKKEDK